jgi:hypothetical protein
MYELVLIACLMGQPPRCEEVHLPFQQPMAMRECMHEAQFRMVEWVRERPDWAVRRWRCELPPA